MRFRMTRARAGYTLMEILVVVAIIVLLAGIFVGVMSMMYADETTVSASDIVRARWAEARSRSIKDGVPYVFGVVWNENVWRIAPEGEEFWGSGAEPMPQSESQSSSGE